MRTPALKRACLGAAVAALALVLSGCAPNAPQDFINYQEGDVARRADQIWDITFAIAVIIFFVVEGLLVYALVKFRHKPGRQPQDFHGNTRLEVILTLVPALILAGLAVPTIRTIFSLGNEPENALKVTVTAHQFWWQYEYPDLGVVTANELHIPEDQPVYITLKGADVIHSFWVPRLGGTQDVVPGRDNNMYIEADDPGKRYLGQCKEFCGLSHANMRLIVYTHTQEEFEAWAEDQAQDRRAPSGIAAQGEQVFLETGCVNCHAIRGTEAAGQTAPDLTHFGSRTTFAGAMFENNEGNLADWLRDPPAVKPGSLMPDYGLTDEQIQQLVAYLMSLK
ncbi:MAG TPA: cytochrome c oxidase subunit II [Actinomycetota bacterium]|nr:cytochrome c oxidase subunit II [Actinomycetota bacterium]